MATVDDLRDDINQVKSTVEALGASLTAVGVALGQVTSALVEATKTINELEIPDEGDDSITFALGTITASTIKVTWDTDRTDVKNWEVGRNGADSQGSGPWSTKVNGDVWEMTFNSLLPATTYDLSLCPIFTDDRRGDVLTLTTRTAGASGGGQPGDGVTAAAKLGWGNPDQVSDEFLVDGRPDPEKWSYCGTYGQGWDGHQKNGRRMPECTEVKNGILVMTGKNNGDTGWLRQKKKVKYGRWEIRSRSRNAGSSGALYHPLHLIWPSPDVWPENGELDFVEYTDPDAKQATAWLHYPHKKGIAIQQAGPFPKNCDMTQWHNFAFEWNSTGVRAWIDGDFWYEVRDGGGPNGRKNIQDMPMGALTIQLDNFSKYGPWRPAVFEVQWVRFYPV
jgi:Glycosyl hydrolases family 16